MMVENEEIIEIKKESLSYWKQVMSTCDCNQNLVQKQYAWKAESLSREDEQRISCFSNNVGENHLNICSFKERFEGICIFLPFIVQSIGKLFKKR